MGRNRSGRWRAASKNARCRTKSESSTAGDVYHFASGGFMRTIRKTSIGCRLIVVFVVTGSVVALMFVVPLLPSLARYYWINQKIRDISTAAAVRNDARGLLKSHAPPSGEPMRTVPPSDLPRSIAKLHPSWVAVRANSVRIEFGSGFFHYGLVCYPSGVRGSGDEMIIDGLWFKSE